MANKPIIMPDGVGFGGSALARFVEWTAYTSTISNQGNATQSMMYMVIGNCLFIRGTIKIGSSLPTGGISFTIPSGYTADFSKHTLGAVGYDAYQLVGRALCYKSNNTAKSDATVARNGGGGNFYFICADGSTYGTPAGIDASAGTFTFAASDTIQFDMSICIS